MSKFIQTQCDSYLNLNNVVRITYKLTKSKEYNEAMLEFIAFDTKDNQYLILGACCKREEIDNNYNILSNKLKEIFEDKN